MHWLLAAVVVIAALNVVTTLQLRRGVAVGAPEASAGPGVPWRGTALVAVAFVAVAAANSAAVSVMSLFVTQRLGLDVVWPGSSSACRRGSRSPRCCSWAG